MEQPATKLLATINRSMREIVPRDPNAAEFRQGNMLGADNRHWFRQNSTSVTAFSVASPARRK
jgi:toxin YhaV